ncbi:hypothetical protein BDW59DRAFT_177955 [Aspergillus cavernicola]|uniref:Zn(2)-C6 fungal-type domain-containing protein n=1 Tax=Aspergillus cavernicola TaxID=176166 RepID=A0ABR4HG55_9EURO
MNQIGEGEFSLDKLPKSVKVRSTCNPCQQAKIRCSHERPSCKRCQKHNLECVYSISRRLGRPAKKRDPALGTCITTQGGSDGQPNKKTRGPKKKKVKEEPMPDNGLQEHSSSPEEKPLFDNISFSHGHFDNISVEDPILQTPTFLDIATTAPFPLSDNVDMASDSWLHEFMSNPFTESTQERGFLGPFEGNDVDADGPPARMSMNTDSLPESVSEATPEPCDLPSSSSYFTTANGYLTQCELMSGSAQGILQGNPVYTEHLNQETLSWSQPLSTLGEDFSTEPSNLFPQITISKRAHDFGFPEDEINVNSNGLARSCPSQNHEQAVQDLFRVNFCTSRTSPLIPIDSILTCQRVLQQLTETIIQCRICSRTRVNILMVAIVSIDNLITTLDRITSAESDVVDQLFPECFNPLVHDYRSDSTLTNHARRYKGGNMQLRTQMDACPLIIGGFFVPSEEKLLFVKRVLHSRLSGLLRTVHRIQLCTQESLPSSASTGRLDMMRTADQRLRLIIMKLNMLMRP